MDTVDAALAQLYTSECLRTHDSKFTSGTMRALYHELACASPLQQHYVPSSFAVDRFLPADIVVARCLAEFVTYFKGISMVQLQGDRSGYVAALGLMLAVRGKQGTNSPLNSSIAVSAEASLSSSSSTLKTTKVPQQHALRISTQRHHRKQSSECWDPATPLKPPPILTKQKQCWMAVGLFLAFFGIFVGLTMAIHGYTKMSPGAIEGRRLVALSHGLEQPPRVAGKRGHVAQLSAADPHRVVPIADGRRVKPTEPPFGRNSTTATQKPRKDCLAFEKNTPSGFAREAPIDSIVSVTFDAPEGSDALSDVVAAMTADMGSESSDYFTFLSKRAAELRTVSTAGALENFAMDVVYTYLNPLAASHQDARRTICQGERECDDKRFRDWNELQHSMRGLYYRAMCTRDGKHCGEAGSAADGALVRHIHIVVADRDQIPEWLNATHPLVSVVTHGELFAGDGNGMPALPTLNSHAIESALHRIPGLSRYFVYFNNDMFFGRRLSFFDYFRPLSPWRQAQREAILLAALTPNVTSSRRTIMFEPIFYFENIEDPNEFFLVRRPTAPSDFNVRHSCSHHPLKASAFFDVAHREPRRFDHLRKLSNFNKKLIVDRIVGGWPSHSFAHYPRLMDLAILTEMQEVDFADVSRATRQQRLRTTESLWTTYVYQYYAMGHRRAVEAKFIEAWHRLDTISTNGNPPLMTFGDLAPLTDQLNGALGGSRAIPLSQDVSKRLAGEKIQGTVVTLSGVTEPCYFFAMLEVQSSIVKFQHELSSLHTKHLFVTLNDDFLFETPAQAQMLQSLFQTVCGEEAPPPWNR